MRWPIRYIVSLALLALFSQGLAQTNLGKLTYDDGLSNSTVLSTCRSSDGFLWIGTRDGLNRYDGVSLKQYLAKPGTNGGFILKHSVGSLPHNNEVDVPLIYADYYFLEALLRYRKLANSE